MIYTVPHNTKRKPRYNTPLRLAQFIRNVTLEPSTYTHQSKNLIPLVHGYGDFVHGSRFPVPEWIFDPCVGRGHLVKPWIREANVIGYDINPIPLGAAHFRSCTPIEALCNWPWEIPDLVLMNPPFNGRFANGMMASEFFLRTIHSLFPGVPTVLITSSAFRHNQKARSKRHNWMASAAAPQIDSIITLPVDTFKGAAVQSEVLFFNMPWLKAHYYYAP